MNKLTSFTKMFAGEGVRIAYTYSEIDEKGNLKSQNKKGSFVVIDKELQTHIDTIEKYINENYLNEVE